jgi:hypothetical protein
VSLSRTRPQKLVHLAEQIRVPIAHHDDSRRKLAVLVRHARCCGSGSDVASIRDGVALGGLEANARGIGSLCDKGGIICALRRRSRDGVVECGAPPPLFRRREVSTWFVFERPPERGRSPRVRSELSETKLRLIRS